MQLGSAIVLDTGVLHVAPSSVDVEKRRAPDVRILIIRLPSDS